MSEFIINKDLEEAIEKSFLKDSYKKYKNFKQNIDKLSDIVKKCSVYLEFSESSNYFYVSFDNKTKKFIYDLFGVYNTRLYAYKDINFINVRQFNVEKRGVDYLLTTAFLNKILTEIRKNFTIKDIRFGGIDTQTFIDSKKTIYEYITFNENFKVFVKCNRNCCIEPTEYKVKQDSCIVTKKLICEDSNLIYTNINMDFNRHYHMSTASQIFINTKDFIYNCFIKFINLTEFGYLVASRTNINSQILIIKVLMRGEVNFKLYDDKVILWSKKYSLKDSDVEQLFKNSDFENNPSTNLLFTNF